jgi:hypothetical protein
MKCGWLVILLILAAPAASTAQGLGAAAARERQKRQQPTATSPAKVYTEEDLAKSKEAQGDEIDATTGDPARTAGEPAAKPEGAGTADPALDELERERRERKLQEAEWRVRFAGAREQLALAEAACWQEVVRTQFYQGIPVQMKVKEFVESEEFRQAKQALADLGEQFRRTGLPPGWAREP